MSITLSSQSMYPAMNGYTNITMSYAISNFNLVTKQLLHYNEFNNVASLVVTIVTASFVVLHFIHDPSIIYYLLYLSIHSLGKSVCHLDKQQFTLMSRKFTSKSVSVAYFLSSW